MSKEIREINPSLIANLKHAKATLAEAQKLVETAEGAIYIAAGELPEQGTTYVTGCKIITKFYDKWSQEKLTELERTWVRKSNLPFPFKKEWKADGKAISYLRDNAKEAYDALAEALTLTPAKPSFILLEEKE